MSVNTKSTVQVATSSPTTTKKQTSKFKTPQKNLTIPILDQELTPSTIRKNPKNWASITKKNIPTNASKTKVAELKKKINYPLYNKTNNNLNLSISKPTCTLPFGHGTTISTF